MPAQLEEMSGACPRKLVDQNEEMTFYNEENYRNVMEEEDNYFKFDSLFPYVEFPSKLENFEWLQQCAVRTGYNETVLRSTFLKHIVLSEIHVFAVGSVANEARDRTRYPAVELSVSHFRALHGSSECQHLNLNSPSVIHGLLMLFKSRSTRNSPNAPDK